ncbi:hypothetical protein [Ruficoccus sp. ZRK36]|uniref:hypothetical protein n=1 Tax=Ruficoccus sp. ZRK36 TaxID=2866311 RepID=UPI001C72F988|nr:hypothetical protein [Ruficoccus sp. ZRK36]QYY35694.1 hypothetical protein K0V07_15515 [Ruficoccus sp. ZRK36]
MRRGLGCAGLICGVFGLAAGLFALFFDYFVSPSLDYESPLHSLTGVLWTINTLLIGLALCLVAGGLMARERDSNQPDEKPRTPPPLPQRSVVAVPPLPTTVPAQPEIPAAEADHAAETPASPHTESASGADNALVEETPTTETSSEEKPPEKPNRDTLG